MKEIKDTLLVGVANSTAIGMNITDCNEYLTLVSLTLAIAYTIYKFFRFEKKKTKQHQPQIPRQKKGEKSQRKTTYCRPIIR